VNICFKILLTTAFVLLNTCLLANEYLTALTTAQTWIDKNCQPGTIAHDEAIKILREIARKPIANEEKIKNIKKEFPRAFQRDEKTLIFVPPISWHIHSLTLAYDIKDSATTRSKTVDVFQDISKFHTAYDGQRKQRAEARSSRFLFGGKINLTGSLETSLQDLSWIKASTNLSTKLSSSYISYSNAEAQLELWSRSQQAVFSRESQRITEMLKQSNIDKFHLSFTMTITNRGNETVHCDLAGAYIPVYSGDRSSNVMARPYGMSEKVLTVKLKLCLTVRGKVKADSILLQLRLVEMTVLRK